MKSRRILPLALIAVVALMSGCRSIDIPPSVTGVGIYLLNVPLPADAVARFQLVESTPTGEILAIVSEQTVVDARRAPIAFDLPYRKSDIRSRAHYGVTCEITSGGRVLFRSPRPFPVLTQGGSSRVEVLLEAPR